MAANLIEILDYQLSDLAGTPSLRYRADDPELLDSIQKYGILELPVAARVGGRSMIVSGAKRLYALSKLGREKAEIRMLGKEIDEREWALLALSANHAGTWSELDRMRTLTVCKKIFSEPEIIQTILPLMGLKSHARIFENYCQVSELAETFLDQIDCGSLPFRGAERWSRLDKKTQAYFAEHVAPKTGFSAGQLAESADMLFDLSRSQRKPAHEIMQVLLPCDFWESFGEDRRAAAGALLRRLRQERYPNLASYEKRFQDARNKLAGDLPELQIRPTDNFEGAGFWVTARIKNREVLSSISRRLSERPDDWQALFDMLSSGD